MRKCAKLFYITSIQKEGNRIDRKGCVDCKGGIFG